MEQLIAAGLAARERANLLRRQRVVTPLSPTRARLADGREVVNFASNNYLGLTHHPRLIAAATAVLQTGGGGAGAAGLITGHTHVHAAAQDALARWKGTEAALLLPSGYQANLAVVQTLAAIGRQGAGVRFLIDKLAHASLIDAARASGAEVRVYPHNTLAKLERLLAEAPDGQLQIVLTESIFSMDGDAADLRGLAEMKRRFGFVLVLDEAHGSGVYGPGGAGYATELGLGGAVDVTVVTLSKAMGSAGGAVCASAHFCAAVLNHGRAYVYSTHVTPATAAWASEGIAVMAAEPGLQARVREVSRHVRAEVARFGFDVPAGDSPIVPVILGDEAAALAAANQLLATGLLVPAVRPPTVPRGASRLRVTVSAAHSDEEVGRLIEALRGLIRPK